MKMVATSSLVLFSLVFGAALSSSTLARAEGCALELDSHLAPYLDWLAA